MNDFNKLAWAYDLLARLIFGKQLRHFAAIHLKAIRSSDRVLILGGGTGRCLECLPAGCRVDFVDKSKAMISRAMNRNTTADVTFHQADFLDWQTASSYEWILAPFFLDGFGKESLSDVLKKIWSISDQRTFLVVTDFRRTKRVRHDAVLWIMHRFFRLTTGLQAREIQDLHSAVANGGWDRQALETSRDGFIYSAKYILQNPRPEN